MPEAQLHTPDDEVVNIAAHLPRVAAEQPFAPAIYFPDSRSRSGRVRYTHYTYRQLDEASDRISLGLRAIGLSPGTRVALMVRPSLELFSLVFGLFKAGIVPVMVDPGIGLKNMKACLARARPEAFIGIWAAQLARLGLRWAKGSVRTVVTVGPRAPWGGHTLAQIEERGARESGEALVRTRAEDMAAILFTSGSTGPPKGACYTHGTFSTQVEALQELYGIEPGEVDLPTFPLFGLFAPALGMTAIVPEMDFTRPAQADPVKLLRAIDDWGVTNAFGSPALVDRLARFGAQHGVLLPTLRRMISAGAPVPPRTIETFTAINQRVPYRAFGWGLAGQDIWTGGPYRTPPPL